MERGRKAEIVAATGTEAMDRTRRTGISAGAMRMF